MMMMSSNTVGNNDFNTAGVTPLDAKKKTKAKKETELKLAKALPDSFERTAPRDTAPEATTAPAPVVEAPQQGGGGGAIPIVLSVASLIGAGIAGWFAVSKGEEAKLAKTVAEATQKEVKTLEKKVTDLTEQGAGVTEDKVI